MRKIMLLFTVLMLVVAATAFAQPPVPAQPEPVVVEAPQPFAFDLGISGDIFYLIGSEGDENSEARQGEFVEGVSLKVANIYGELISANVVAADMLSDDRDMLVGGGVSVNIPVLVKDFLKGEWVANLINPSVGGVLLVDMTTGDVIPALHLQVIRYDL